MEKELAKETLTIACMITISKIIYDFCNHTDSATMTDLIDRLRPFFNSLEQLEPIKNEE